MTVDDDFLAALVQRREELWRQRGLAEKAKESTSEAMQFKSLTDDWATANRMIDAAKVLLANKPVAEATNSVSKVPA